MRFETSKQSKASKQASKMSELLLLIIHSIHSIHAFIRAAELAACRGCRRRIIVVGWCRVCFFSSEEELQFVSVLKYSTRVVCRDVECKNAEGRRRVLAVTDPSSTRTRPSKSAELRNCGNCKACSRFGPIAQKSKNRSLPLIFIIVRIYCSAYSV